MQSTHGKAPILFPFLSFLFSPLIYQAMEETKQKNQSHLEKKTEGSTTSYEAYIHCFLLTKKHISPTSTPLSQSENYIHSRSLSFVSTEEEIVTAHCSLSFTKLESDKKKRHFFMYGTIRRASTFPQLYNHRKTERGRRSKTKQGSQN